MRQPETPHSEQQNSESKFADPDRDGARKGAEATLESEEHFRRLSEAVRLAEEKYRAIFENAVEGIFQTTADGAFITANPAMARILGFTSPEELIREHSAELKPNCLDPERREEFKRLLDEHGSVQGFEYQGRRKDGQKIWLSDNVRAVNDENGALLWYEGTAEDITERKQAQAALRESTERLRLAVQAANVGLFDWDLVTNQVIVSREWKSQLGYEDHEVGTDFSEWERRVHPDDLAPMLELIQRDLAGPERAHEAEFRMRHRDGSWRWIYTRAEVHLNNDGKPVRMLGCHLDITERKQAGAVLRKSEERYRDLVENSRELICTHDLSGQVLSANAAAAQAMGFAADEVMEGKNIRDALAPGVRDEFDQYMANLCERGETSGFMRVETITGERRIWEYYTSLRTEGSAEPIVRAMASDITDRKRAEEALRASEEKYRTILERMEEGYAEVDLRGTYVFVNDSFCRITGRSRSELLGVNYREIFDREQSRLLYETYHNVYLTGAPITGFEYVVTRKDGTRRFVEESVILKRDGEGRPIGFTGIRRDTTERKQAEEALSKSEYRYRSIFSFAPVGIYQSLRDGTLITVNKTLAEMLGYDSVEELLKVNVADVYMAADERERLIRKYSTCGFVVDEEVHWKRKDGVGIWLQLNARISKHAKGLPEQFEGFLLDITERKQAAEALRKNEQRFRALIEQSHDGIALFGADGVVYASQSTANVLGYLPEEVSQRGMLEFVRPDWQEAVRQQLAESLRCPRVGIPSEAYVRHKDGEYRFLEGTFTNLLDEPSVGAIVNNYRDVTERKRAEERIRAQLDELLRWQEVTLGREDRIQELKREVNQLCRRLGDLGRYASQADADAADQP